MSGRIYSTSKLAWHPEALDALRAGEITPPILVQWFPTNICNQACEFCSYGSGPEAIRAKITDNPARSAWKNTQLMDTRDSMPKEKMLETVECLKELGVKALEITGGGEPFAYPFIDDLLVAMLSSKLELGLVTNGTLLNHIRLGLLQDLDFKWARVSIDAGTAEDYCRTRNVPQSHWDKAWSALHNLVLAKHNPECRVGMGFTIDRHNGQHLYAALQRARDHGVDNVRVALSFTPDKTKRWQDVLDLVHAQLDQAKTYLEGPGFVIYDLTREREHNVSLGRQEYPYCAWKDIGCVIGADQNVYACCSWAYNKAGLMGSIRERSFTDLWVDEGATWRQQHDPRRDCRIHCLYEKRNIEALRLMMDRTYAKKLELGADRPAHINFI